MIKECIRTVSYTHLDVYKRQHVGTVLLGLLAVYGLNMLGTILSTNLFSGTSPLDLVLSEVFMLVVSLIVGIISAGFGYMPVSYTHLDVYKRQP